MPQTYLSPGSCLDAVACLLSLLGIHSMESLDKANRILRNDKKALPAVRSILVPPPYQLPLELPDGLGYHPAQRLAEFISQPGNWALVERYGDWKNLRPLMLSALSLPEQQVLACFHLRTQDEGGPLSSRETAEAMCLSVDYVRKLARSAAAKLRRRGLAVMASLEDDFLARDISILGLSQRVERQLRGIHIVKVEALLKRSEDDLLLIHYFGETQLEEVRQCLSDCDRRLRDDVTMI